MSVSRTVTAAALLVLVGVGSRGAHAQATPPVATPAAPAAPAAPAPPAAPAAPAAPTSAPAAEEPKARTLHVGDKAPALSIAKWIKGSEVKSFESGKVYVVEFWATWCGPCRVSIPHLTELQGKYKDKGVVIIGVSSNESRGLRDVEPFVNKQGDKMNYTVAWDQDAKTNEAWMDASGQQGIPTAFIVNQDGKVAWIGHPMDGMDTVLEKVVNKQFDLEKEAKQAKRRAEVDAKSRPLLEKAEAAMGEGDKKKVLELLDEIIAIDPPLQGQWVFNKFHMMATQMKELEKAYAYAKEASAGAIKEDAMALNAIAWTILDDESIQKRDLPLAKSLATMAAALTGEKDPQVLDTLARALFDSGEKDKAIEMQTKAINLAGENAELKEALQRHLDEYKRKNTKG